MPLFNRRTKQSVMFRRVFTLHHLHFSISYLLHCSEASDDTHCKWVAQTHTNAFNQNTILRSFGKFCQRIRTLRTYRATHTHTHIHTWFEPKRTHKYINSFPSAAAVGAALTLAVFIQMSTLGRIQSINFFYVWKISCVTIGKALFLFTNAMRFFWKADVYEALLCNRQDPDLQHECTRVSMSALHLSHEWN